MNDVQRASEALGERSVTDGTFLRALLRYPSWLVPASVSARGAVLVGARREDGSAWLEVYSERSILENERNHPKHTKLPTKLLTTGTLWASLLEDGYAGVVIDPGERWSRTFTAGQIPMLRRWSRTLLLEDTLPLFVESLVRYETARSHETHVVVPRVLRALRDFPFFDVLRRRDEDDPLARCETEGEGSSFVAAFTAGDCAERYRASLPNAAEWSIVERPGVALLTEILDRRERGLVLNPRGPAPRIALSAAHVRALLDLTGDDELPAVPAAKTATEPSHAFPHLVVQQPPKPPPAGATAPTPNPSRGPSYRLLDADRRWLVSMFAEPFHRDLLDDRDLFARDWKTVEEQVPHEPRERHLVILRHACYAYLWVELENVGGILSAVRHTLFEGEEARLRHLEHGFRIRDVAPIRRALPIGAPALASIRQAFGPNAREAPVQGEIPRADGATERYHRVLDGGVVVVVVSPDDRILELRFVEGEPAFTLLQRLHQPAG